MHVNNIFVFQQAALMRGTDEFRRQFTFGHQNFIPWRLIFFVRRRSSVPPWVSHAPMLTFGMEVNHILFIMEPTNIYGPNKHLGQNHK
jgi:hypothetical protein